MIEASKAHITLATRVGQLQLEAALAEENIVLLAEENQSLRTQLDERTTQLSETSRQYDEVQEKMLEVDRENDEMREELARWRNGKSTPSDHEVSNDEQAAPDSESERATPTVITDI